MAAKAKKYIGVDIGGTSIKLGIVDGRGTVLQRLEVEHITDPERGSVMERMIRGIRKLCGEEGLPISDFSGIGVSAAGCIDSVKGVVAENGGNIQGWSRTPVCEKLKEEFRIPATIANDANCAVLGEWWTGAAKGYTDVVAVTLGTGVGGGIITGGRLLEGTKGFAGEIGHFPTHAGEKECICGMKGCFERYASTSALIREAGKIDPEWSSGRILFGAAAEGKTDALKLIGAWIDEVAYGIAGYVHVFNPQLILIGGGVSRQENLLIRPLRDKVLSLIMNDFTDGLESKSAELGNDAGIVGAVKYCLDKQQ